MNTALSQSLVVECLGWTLVHFLWQGVAIAALFAVTLRVLRRATSNHRYLAGCAALLLLAGTPLVTFAYLLREQRPPPLVALLASSEAADPGVPIASVTKPLRMAAPRPAAPITNPSFRLELSFPWVVAAWAVGVSVLSLRLLAGWWRIKRLQSLASAALDEIWHRKLAELGARLGVARPVKLFQSAMVEVPTLVGWLRPMILLPASCLAGLTPGQLESILAHELAHIRRHDYLVNLLQSAVETLLFYHPVVWWVSCQVREERENCCDDLAVEVCGDRIAYARALATLEELRQAPAQLALAASGAPLLQRIRRLAGQPGRAANAPAWPVVGMIALLMVLTFSIALRSDKAIAGGGEAAANTNAALQPPVAATLNTEEAVNGQSNSIGGADLKDDQAGTTVEKNWTRDVNSTNPQVRTSAANPGKGRQEITDKLKSIRLDSVTYDGVPLTDVIKNLSELARRNDPDKKGINFFFNRPMDGPDATAVKVKFSPGLSNVNLMDVLDAIATNSSPPVRFSILEYAVTFSIRQPGDDLVASIFRLDPNAFGHPLPGVNTNRNGGGLNWIGYDELSFEQAQIENLQHEREQLGRTSGLISALDEQLKKYQERLGDAATRRATETEMANIRAFLDSVGVGMDTNNATNIGKWFVWNLNKKGTLMVHATPKDLELVQAGIEKMNAPPPALVTNEAKYSIKTTANTNPRQKIMAKLNSIEVDSVKYDGLPLIEVIKDVQARARQNDPDHEGINLILMSPVLKPIPPSSNDIVTPPDTFAASQDARGVKVTINTNPGRVRLVDLLDDIVIGADQPIHFSILDYAVAFSLYLPMEMRTFHLDPNAFAQASGSSQMKIRAFFQSLGEDWGTNNPANVGKMFVWNDRTGTLLVRATSKDLELIQAGIEKLKGSKSTASRETNEATAPTPTTPDIQKNNSTQFLARERIADKLKSIRVDSVKYQAMPLPDVLKNLTEISKQRDAEGEGINILYNRQVKMPALDPNYVKVTINPAFHNLRLVDVLDAVVQSADKPISYVIYDYAVVFQIGGPWEMRTFHVNSNFFDQKLVSVSGRSTANAPANIMPQIAVGSTASNQVSYEPRIRQFLQSIGVDFSTNNPENAGKTFIWNSRSQTLLVRASHEDLDLIEAALSSYKMAPQVTIRVRCIHIEEVTGPEKFVSGLFPNAQISTNFLKGILSDAQSERVINAIQMHDGSDEFLNEQVTTEDDRQTRMTIDSPEAFASVIEITPHVSANTESVDLAVFAPLERLYKPEPQLSATHNSMAPPPSRSANEFTTNNATVGDGQTLVLGYPNVVNAKRASGQFRQGYVLIFVTPTLINPDGTRFHPDSVPPPPQEPAFPGTGQGQPAK